MEATELFRKVRKIEIKTRGLSNQIFSGHYHSAFKGKGMAFSEVREYQYGDDIRSIDWNVTARFNHPFVKIFDEERELTVMLLVDVSGSNAFGTRRQLKEEMITEISAVLAFSAIQNNDKVGVIFFSDIIEKFIPPKKGTSHILRIIRELIDFHPGRQGTDIGAALQYFTQVIKKRCTAFLFTDFFDSGYENALKIAARKHDLVAIRIVDPRERELPDMGLVKLKDTESGRMMWVDTSLKEVRDQFKQQASRSEEAINWLMSRSGIDWTQISVDEDYVNPLMRLFKKREKRF
ncbi:MAG TPA: DUF58 domain-containing protein [Bacteroidales bacterium]|nr:DUF58 domain-containing protein [Bacteroidales bacterium]HSA43274.1 DUF58 domain-containing protein [Bacteroidales bacterium]